MAEGETGFEPAISVLRLFHVTFYGDCKFKFFDHKFKFNYLGSINLTVNLNLESNIVYFPCI